MPLDKAEGLSDQVDSPLPDKCRKGRYILMGLLGAAKAVGEINNL
jgi:hypothetical protein